MASSRNPKRQFTRTKTALCAIATISIIGFMVLMLLLAFNIFTIPYLTPLAHLIGTLLSPFIPLIFPFHLGLFVKICSYKTGQPCRSKALNIELRPAWKGKKSWVFIGGCWVTQHLGRVVGDVGRLLYGGQNGKIARGKNWELEMCGLEGCKAEWAEMALTCLVVLAEGRGWKWEGGWLDCWVEELVKLDPDQDAVVSMEAGEADVEIEVGEEMERLIKIEWGEFGQKA